MVPARKSQWEEGGERRKESKKKKGSTPTVYRCALCHYRSTSQQSLRNHLLSSKHISRKNADMVARQVKKMKRPGDAVLHMVQGKPVNVFDGSAAPPPAKESNLSRETFDIRLIENFKLMIVGPSRCGKTTWVLNLLINLRSFCREPPTKVIYIYAIFQRDTVRKDFKPYVDKFMQDDEQKGGLKERLDAHIKKKGWKREKILLIFDDLIQSKSLRWISQLYMVFGRHAGFSLIFLGQRFFGKSDDYTRINTNHDYTIYFNNPGNQREIVDLSNRFTPETKEVLHIYKAITQAERGFSYLMINNTQQCDRRLRFLSHLFKTDGVVHAYVSGSPADAA